MQQVSETMCLQSEFQTWFKLPLMIIFLLFWGCESRPMLLNSDYSLLYYTSISNHCTDFFFLFYQTFPLLDAFQWWLMCTWLIKAYLIIFRVQFGILKIVRTGLGILFYNYRLIKTADMCVNFKLHYDGWIITIQKQWIIIIQKQQTLLVIQNEV